MGSAFDGVVRVALAARVKPATVIDWHRRGFRRYWRWRSRKPGRPRIPDEHIALIRRISRDQPTWGEDRIAEELAIKLGVRHSTSTIRKYMVRRQQPGGGQTWKTFVKNHASQIFAVDFLTQPTALFTMVYVFVVMEVATRRIVLINATTSPGLGWVKQQIRQATTWAQSPRFLIHDNDGIFGSSVTASGALRRTAATGVTWTSGGLAQLVIVTTPPPSNQKTSPRRSQKVCVAKSPSMAVTTQSRPSSSIASVGVSPKSSSLVPLEAAGSIC